MLKKVFAFAPAKSSAIEVHRSTFIFLVLPSSAAPFRLRNVGTNLDFIEHQQDSVRVVALVRGEFFDA